MVNFVDDFNGSKILIRVGDGGSPEVFTPRCTINAQRGIELTTNVIEDTQIDCDSPDDPAPVTRTADTYSSQITGEGRAHGPDIQFLTAWWKSGEAKNCQVLVDHGGTYEHTFSGQYLLTTLGFAGERKEKATGSITLQSNGPLEHVRTGPGV